MVRVAAPNEATGGRAAGPDARQRGRTMVRFLLIIAALMGFAAPAHAEGESNWWDPAWTYRKPVTIDTTASGVNMSGPVGTMPVLVRLTDANYSFDESQPNGADIRFVDADGKTPLAYQIESFSPQDGIATAWVAVPNVNGGEKKTIFLYFGNAEAGANTDAAQVWDADTAFVYHFTGRNGQPVTDASANKANSANPPPGLISGIAGQAAQFPGSGGLTIAPAPALDIAAGSGMTFTAWVRPANLAGDQIIFQGGTLQIGLSNGAPFVGVGGARAVAGAQIAANQWSHIAVVHDNGAFRVYVNGREAAAASAAMPAITGPYLLAPSFAGALDEVRLAKSARSANMLAAMAGSEGAGGKLTVVSDTAEEASEGGGVFFFVLSKLHGIDAGVVVLCLILLAVAATVMYMKVTFVGRTAKANAQFMKRFRQMHEDLAPLDSGDIPANELAFMRQGQLAKLYETGMEEIQIRQRKYGNAPLSGESVEALRAAIDAQVVEENQKLDQWMVILTIAISGGPFIGLLGTVMGVMTTFGGVAMAGDVNVNAIAPGIAAALLATIAGLACAIPSLFGYNYLNTRITTISDEMRVFVDRLVTRLAEMQSERAAPPPHRMAAE